MVKGISYWSIEGGLSGERPIEEALREAEAAGFAAIELAIAETGVLTPSTDESTCERYRQAAENHHLRLETLASGMSWSCSPTSPDKSTRDRAIQLHHSALHRAAWLGADSMLFVPGAIKIPWDPTYAPVRYQDAFNWAREAVEQLIPIADHVSVNICIENVWNGLFYSPLEFADFIDSFKSSRLGIYLDVGNLLGYQQHPPFWIDFLGERIKRVHIKDFKASVGGMAGFCELLDGDVPWEATMAALKKISYEKTIVAEMIPPGPGLLTRTSKAMDKILSL